jgi:alpha 1,2-mannosyltransferase
MGKHTIHSNLHLASRNRLSSPPKTRSNTIRTERREIVMAAGDRDPTIRARTNIRFLKSYNCSLPVEIFHFSNELSGQDIQFLEELNKLDEGSGMKITVRIVNGVKKGND